MKKQSSLDASINVIPAHAGIQKMVQHEILCIANKMLDSRLRKNDNARRWNNIRYTRMVLSLSRITIIILSLLLCATLAIDAFATEEENKIIRFVTTKSNEVNARSGPGTKYPTEWVFIKKGEPLAVIAEFEQWRYVRDISGDVGWVHSSVLSGKRGVVVIGDKVRYLRKHPSATARVIAKLSNNIRCQFKKQEGDWCKIKCEGYTGWIENKYIWGGEAENATQ